MHLLRDTPGNTLSLLGTGVEGMRATTALLTTSGGISAFMPVARVIRSDATLTIDDAPRKGWAHATCSTDVSYPRR